jgi:hypothetical protein
VLQCLTGLTFLWSCLGPTGSLWHEPGTIHVVELFRRGWRSRVWEQVLEPLTGVAFDTEVGIVTRFPVAKMHHHRRLEVLDHLRTCNEHWGGTQCTNTRCVNQWVRSGTTTYTCGDVMMDSQSPVHETRTNEVGFLLSQHVWESVVCVVPSGHTVSAGHQGTVVGTGGDLITWDDSADWTPDVHTALTLLGDAETHTAIVTMTLPVLQQTNGADDGETSRLGTEQVVTPETPSGPPEDVVSAQHHAWLIHAQSKKTVVLAQIQGAVDNVHGWAKATVQGRVRDTSKWIIQWEHQSTIDTLKSACEIKKMSADLTSWEKETVKKWTKIRKQIQKRKQFATPKSNNVSVILSALNMLARPLHSCALMAAGFFHQEILTPAVMTWKCCQFFGDGKRVVEWAPRSMEVHVPKWGQNEWAISSIVMYNLGVGPCFAYVSASARPQNIYITCICFGDILN